LLVDAKRFAWLIPFALTFIPSFLALYFVAFAASYKKINHKFNLIFNYQKILIFAVLWLLFEMLRSYLFGGFPWNLIGYSLSFSNAAIQSSSIFGIYGLSFFATIFCLAPVLFFKGLSRNNPSALSDKVFATILVILFVGNFVFGYCRLQNTKIVESEGAKLRLVQANIKQDLKWNPEQKYRNLVKHIKLSNEVNNENIAAVIWSETAVPYSIDSDSNSLLEELQKAVPQNGVLITGALRTEYRDMKIASPLDVAKQKSVADSQDLQFENVWNSVFALNKNGIVNYYDKHHLVPFGEYIPFAKFLPFVEKITGGGEGFGEGEGPKTLAVPDFAFSPLICYESIFSSSIINKKNRPNLLVNVTNDAWFGASSGPFQHFDMSKMRAVEYGIPLARVANSGITAFIDPLGRVKNSIALNQEGFIDVNLVSEIDETIFSKFGYWPLFAVIILIAGFLLISGRRK